MVRYRTRDLTRLLPGTAYPAFRRMQKVTGRTDDMMIVRGVNVFPTQVEEQILGIEGLAPHYQCVLTRPGNLDELTVQRRVGGRARTRARRPRWQRDPGPADQAPDRGDAHASRSSHREPRAVAGQGAADPRRAAALRIRAQPARRPGGQ